MYHVITVREVHAKGCVVPRIDIWLLYEMLEGLQYSWSAFIAVTLHWNVQSDRTC